MSSNVIFSFGFLGKNIFFTWGGSGCGGGEDTTGATDGVEDDVVGFFVVSPFKGFGSDHCSVFSAGWSDSGVKNDDGVASWRYKRKKKWNK